ncbi:MAG: CNNM domain-containing protein [Clostridiaceae bacterium]|nr:CNNM domain-containing protein [Clostridiaceae bacterium]
MHNLLPYLGIAFLIFLSAFFSGSEIAFASVNQARLKKTADGGDLRSQTAHLISTHYEDALGTILIGNNLVNIAASSVATVIAITLAGDDGAIWATVVMTVIILIFGEIMPKIVAKDRCDRFVLYAALPLRVLMLITRPIVRAVNAVINRLARLWGEPSPEADAMSADELRTIIETVEDEGVIDEDRSDLLQSAITFGGTAVEKILTPRVDMEALDLSRPQEEQMAALLSASHSRLPVYDEDIDRISGVLYLNHVFKVLAAGTPADLRSLAQPVCFLHRSARLPVALSELRRRNQHLAVVVDDYGGTCGIVTLEDILEELVGELQDERDAAAPSLQKVGENEYLAGGSLSVEDLLDELDEDARTYDGDSVSVGGWCIERLGGFPKPGDCFVWQNLTFTVEAVDELRVLRVRVSREPKTEKDD